MKSQQLKFNIFKQFSKLLAVGVFVLGSFTYAQTEDRPWAVTFGVNGINFLGANNSSLIGNSGQEAKMFTEFFNVEDQWSIAPLISQVTFARYMGSSGVSLDFSGTINVLSQYNNAETNDGVVSFNDDIDGDYWAVDLGVNYHLNSLWDGMKWFDPYLRGNGGYNWIDTNTRNVEESFEESGFVVGGGLGINFWVTDNKAIKVQSTFKNNITEVLEDYNYFQHTLGLTFAFGGSDVDGDGILDKYDECPDVAGIAEFNGCPDTDADGIEDSKDECPDVAGISEFNGCNDTDGDGVADPQDECVDVVGLKELNGCPDADADGIADDKDDCPQISGPSENKGCPWLDTDKDGLADKYDACPEEMGDVSNNGCPKINEAVKKALINYAKTIKFDSGKASIKKQSEEVLNDIVDILKEYPNAKFTIDGHTDSFGSANLNKALSNSRANSVKEYLVTNGISSDRLTTTGYGEEKPLDSNETSDGRARNRRVEIKLSPSTNTDNQYTEEMGTVLNNESIEAPEDDKNILNKHTKTILFDTGKASIKKQSTEVLNDVVGILKENPNTKFTIDGHTDSVGSAKLNKELSNSRVNSVKEYLVSNGIAADRLITKGYGEEKPLYSNNNSVGRARNRRVEINIVK
jgi:outer membrane protein OmpA-like peptidoglycan-associated protein